MVFQEYTLASLREELKQEFGLDSDENAIVARKINDAHKWIVLKRNGLWPWQQKELVIDVQPMRTGTANFTQGSATATWVSGSKPIDPTTSSGREILSAGQAPGDITVGFLVRDFADPTITLDSQFVGSTIAGQAFSVVVGYYRLPDDYQRMLSLFDISLNKRILPRTPEQFDEIRYYRNIIAGIDAIYTVTKDPFPESNAAWSPNLFLSIYPYPGDRKTIRGRYVADVQDLVADGDVPLLPRNHRHVIFWIAAWQLAMKYKEVSQIREYRNTADEFLQELLTQYGLEADDAWANRFPDTGIAPPLLPPGFPDWRLGS